MDAKRSEIPDRRITYWDLFGSEMIDDEYEQDKILAENISKLCLENFFKRSELRMVSATEGAMRARNSDSSLDVILETGAQE